MLTSDWSNLNIFRRVALLMAAKKSNLDFLSKSEFVSIENDTSRGETKTWSQQEVCRHLFFSLFVSLFFSIRGRFHLPCLGLQIPGENLLEFRRNPNEG